MNELLDVAVDGHGGIERWRQLSRFRARVSIKGAIWDLKRQPGLLDDVLLEGETRDQRVLITPFPAVGSHTTWEPHRQTSETPDGIVLTERLNPERAFDGPAASPGMSCALRTSPARRTGITS